MNPRYIIQVTPCPAPRMTISDKWKKRTCVTKYHAFKDQFTLNCNVQGYFLEEILDIQFIIPMPNSWSQKKKCKMDGRPHQQTPDTDNILKSVMDSFKINDGFVWNVKAVKVWGYEGRIIIF